MTRNPNEASTWSPNTQNQGPKEGLEEEIQMQKSLGSFYKGTRNSKELC